MISASLVKKIELGPRQMTFGFDGRVSEIFNIVFSHIEQAYKHGGPVDLDRLIQSEIRPDDLFAPEILQTTFWLAEELKIHFFIDGRIVPPQQAKQVLIQNPDTPVFIVTNKPVDSHRFEQVKKACRFFLPPYPGDSDQYTFSRILINELKDWQDKLKIYSRLAAQPGFPGSREIKNSIVLLNKILERQDSYSLILTCFKYQSKILKQAETIDVLTRFYTQKHTFWQNFIDRMQDFENSLVQIKSDVQIYPAHQRLSEIMNSPFPFPLVAQAEKLLPEVDHFHHRVQQKKLEHLRSEAQIKIDKIIKKLISLFDTFESDKEYRNRCLHKLRSLNRKIKNSRRIEEIDKWHNDAKDLFVDVIEEM